MSKIVTITANTSLDNVIEVEHLEVGGVSTARRSVVVPSGKGINAARTVEALGRKVVALGFAGKASLESFHVLTSSFLRVDLTAVAGETRRNVTILDLGTKLMTHIQRPGFEIAAGDVWRLEEAIRKSVEPGDVVVLAGSLPRGVPSDTYKKLIELAHDAQARVVFDSSGEHLRKGLEARPEFIKPNIRELEELMGESIGGSETRIVKAACEIVGMGIEGVVVSRGGDGIIAVRRGDHRSWRGHAVVDGPVVSTVSVGAGDALVGGLAAGLLDGRGWENVLRLAVACGSAKVLTSDPGVVRRDDIDRLLRTVVLTAVTNGSEGASG